jgi:hypothetical protein
VKTRVLGCSIAAALSMAASACSFDEPPAIGEDVEELGTECETWGCPNNAASMGKGLPFHDVDGSGRFENDAGLRYVSFTLNLKPLRLYVEGDELMATDGYTVYSGTALRDGLLTFQRGEQPYYVRIVNVDTTAFWVDPEPVWTYRFEYLAQPTDADGTPVCPEFPDSDDGEWSGMAHQTALVFTGDRYDAAGKTVYVEGTGQWFNVACARTALAKMHLLRHTEAGSDADHRTTREERQAMLKMLTADLCGTGYPFTQDGERVFYMDAKGWHSFGIGFAAEHSRSPGGRAREYRTIESIWTHEGAICLNEPRRAREERARGGHIAWWNNIRERCVRRFAAPDFIGDCPEVPDQLKNWTDLGYAITANPY